MLGGRGKGKKDVRMRVEKEHIANIVRSWLGKFWFVLFSHSFLCFFIWLGGSLICAVSFWVVLLFEMVDSFAFYCD